MSLLTDFFVAGGGATIKSIQRGTLTGTSVTQTSTTVTSVTMAMSELRLLGFTMQAGTIDSIPRIVLANATTITMNMGTASGIVIASWELIEWQ